MPGNRLKHTS